MEVGMLDFPLTVLYMPVSQPCSWYDGWSEASAIDGVQGEYAGHVSTRASEFWTRCSFNMFTELVLYSTELA